MSVEAQVDLLMRGTRFADEADYWGAERPEGGELRSRMQAELRDKLRLGRPLRVYLGVDPTSTELHVGHFVPLQKLRRFQDQGHQVVFLIGDYTATIGDPSEQTSERKRLTHEQVLELAGSYTEQAYRILDPSRTEVRHNGDWLGKLSFADIIELASIFPMKQIVARRDFQRRMEQGESLRFHESLYALMQGYDAYMLKCDVQVGGYDQHFNMLAGRAIQEHFGDKPHVMLTNPLLIGTDGRKMSKSYGNVINVHDAPFDMYGKTMRMADAHIPAYLELASSLDADAIDTEVQQLQDGANPMEVKEAAGFRPGAAVSRRGGGGRGGGDVPTRVVQRQQVPDEVPEMSVPPHLLGATWVDLCAGLELSPSKAEARRLMRQGGFYIEQTPVKDTEARAEVPPAGILVRLGKRRYYRLLPGA